MLCRHRCGCVTWHGTARNVDVYVCDRAVHTESDYHAMQEFEIEDFYRTVRRYLGLVGNLALMDARLAGRWEQGPGEED